jgi:excinuclease ABC subunit A
MGSSKVLRWLIRRQIQIRGASEHNLDAIDVSLPAERLVVITGVSGSGKSSLAFDTIHREGQRRYLRSFSAHARQYLGRMERPAVEEITGLSPTVCLEQRRLSGNPRSTVGTLSEIQDHLRLLYARSGRAPCPDCGAVVDGVVDGVGGRRICPACGHDHQGPESSFFSFNTAAGACAACGGLGEEDWVDPALLVAHPEKSLRAGALVPTTPSGYIVYSQVTIDVLDEVCRAHGFDVDTPWQELTDDQRQVVFFGSDRLEVPFGKHPLESRLKWSGITARPRETGHYKGLVPTIADIVRRNRNKNAMRFARSRPCAACGGARLGPGPLAVTYGDRTIADLARLSVEALVAFFDGPPPAGTEGVVAPLVERITARLSLLMELGLDHLTLDRPTPSLSAGEGQRVRLATVVGGGLRGITYVLDEPSVGLHARDTRRLLGLLASLRDGGNSVLVVEHDQAVMRAADWLVDIGPGAGSDGGRLLWSGSPEVLADPSACPEGAGQSATRRFLSGEASVASSGERRRGSGELEVRGARQHNLRNIDVSFLLAGLNVVTGVSGSGKSTLVMTVLAQALRRLLHSARGRPGDHDAIVGAEHLDKVVEIDQAPIGRTPRSNPATYTKLFDRVRGLFAATPEARARGYGKGRFSFNNAGGRCEACQGAGVQTIGMHFLGDVAVRCDGCQGRRFNDETLEIRIHGLSVHDVLELDVHRAREIFGVDKVLSRQLGALEDLGLGYLALGQPSTTLSGGEAQRVKLASELARPATGRTLYLLDEPTTGLHDQDLLHLLAALDRLVEAGNTVIAIEHHPDVIRCADRVVDLGPGAGVRGGRLVALGTPEQVATVQGSVTGQVLRQGDVDPAPPSSRDPAVGKRSGAREEIRLEGVRTHNLQSVDVRIPSQSLTVITGVSGSGKSSLAFDTLYAEGQRRFTETLSPYARRHMEQLPRPPLASASGLTPTIGISRRTLAANPRSTVGTLTELYDLYRLIYSRAGESRCPACDVASEDGACPDCGVVSGGPLTASMFSFNHHLGSCPACRGLGSVKSCDPDKLVTHPERPLTDGALEGHKTGRFYGEPDGQYVAILRRVGQVLDLDFGPPWEALSEEARRVAMFGTGDAVYDVVWSYDRKGRTGDHRFERPWPGFVALVDTEYLRKHGDRRGEAMEGVLSEQPCTACDGERLEPFARAVRFAGRRLGNLCRLTVDQARGWFDELERGSEGSPLSPRQRAVTADARLAILETLAVIADVGLGYLQADRRAGSLSGGEARRLQLAALLGADLCGVTYVLDEPTIGLHSADTEGLVRTLGRLRDRGNTVVVVEHDLEVIRAADHVIELGPGPGRRGGRIVAQGSVVDLERSDTPTGRLLVREGSLEGRDPPRRSRRSLTPGITVVGAHAHNLAQLDVSLPAGGLVVLSGVSGSGKTTLLHDVVGASAVAGCPVGCREVTGLERFGRVVVVDPSPLGSAPSSNPATYTGLFEGVRSLFARTEDALGAGFKKGRFSFNAKAGQCGRCKGLGALRTPMGFLADVWVRCDACRGARFNDETLAVRYRGHSIADVLAMSVEEAAVLFAEDRRLAAGLEKFVEVGLGYLQLGQGAPTLSGGESQRVKLVAELLRGDARSRTKNDAASSTLYLLDEPTVGLHGADVETLLALLEGLGEAGHTVYVVEHHRDVLRAADWIIDLGPGGGPAGGHLVAQGTPEQVARVDASLTARIL